MGSQQRVIVVGAGNAALVAAVAAAEEGATVDVLESAPHEERGGNSRFSGGAFRFTHEGKDDVSGLLANDAWLEKAKFGGYTADDYKCDIQRLSQGRSDEALVDVLVRDSRPTMKWMADRGVQWELHAGKNENPDTLASLPAVRLRDGLPTRSVGEGAGLVERLFAAVEPVAQVHYATRARDLILSNGRVVGVRATSPDGDVNFHGNVVLASGGFEANAELRRRYLGKGWDLVKVRGTKYNTGRMLLAAMDAGAHPWGHWGGSHAVPVALDAPDVGDLPLKDRTARYSYTYGVTVNIHGQRFLDEGEDDYRKTYAKVGAEILAQPGSRAFQIFDQQAVELLQPRYETTQPFEADSIEGLAHKISISELNLRRTIEEYNASTAAGSFDPYRNDGLQTVEGYRPPKSNWAVPIEKPPFLAYGVTCGLTFTYGGIRVDGNAQALDVAGRPIDGLFATGEITGGFFYHNYPAGAGLMRGAVFGLLAGRHAAAR